MLEFQIRIVDKDDKVCLFKTSNKMQLMNELDYLSLAIGKSIKRFSVNVIPNSDKFNLEV